MKMKALALAALAGAAVTGAHAQVYVASGLPLAIPDGTLPAVTNTINVPDSFLITDVNVIFRATHTFRGDVDLVLIRGTSYIVLSSDNGTGGDNFTNVRFDQAAAVAITASGTANNLQGNFRPEGSTGTLTTQGLATGPGGLPNTAAVSSLNAFNGTDAIGDWTLWIDDDAAGDVGTVTYWSLEFNGAVDPTGFVVPSPAPAFSGDFTGTPNLLASGVAQTGTTIYTSPVGAQPGITDGAGELALGTRYATTTGDVVGNEVGYRIEHAGGDLVVTLTGLSTDLDLFILGAAGTPASSIADSESISTTESVTIAAAAPGTYYAVVETFGTANAGSTYTITYTAVAPSPAFSGNFTSVSPPNVLANNVPQTGTTVFAVASPQPFLTDGSGENALGTRYATSTGDQVGNEVGYLVEHLGGDATFTLTGLTSDANLYLLGSDGTPASAILDSEVVGTGNELIQQRDLPAGVYYVVVDTVGATNVGTPYTITYSNNTLVPLFSGDFTGTPNDLACDTPTTGTNVWDPAAPQPGISNGAGAAPNTYPTSTFTQVGNEIAYRITWPGGPFAATLTGLAADLDLFLLGSAGTTASAIADSESFGTTSEAINIADLTAGTYYLIVETFLATSASTYTVNVVCPPPPPCPCTTDYNNSGSEIADLDDLIAFFDDFNSADPAAQARADVNCTGEGSIPDVDDIIRFFEIFANGCP